MRIDSKNLFSLQVDWDKGEKNWWNKHCEGTYKGKPAIIYFANNFKLFNAAYFVD